MFFFKKQKYAFISNIVNELFPILYFILVIRIFLIYFRVILLFVYTLLFLNFNQSFFSHFIIFVQK